MVVEKCFEKRYVKLSADLGRMIGSGGQSSIYATVNPEGKYIKVFKNEEDFQAEVIVLRRLAGVAGVPQLIATASANISFMAEPVGQSLRHYFGNSEVLYQVSRCLVSTLHVAHDMNVFHRDIGPGNIVVLNGGKALLVDWATSVQATDLGTVEYRGATLYAANVVLKELSKREDHAARIVIPYSAAMDLESLVKTMFFMMFPTYVDALHGLHTHTYGAALAFWIQCEAEHPLLQSLLQVARNGDYDALRRMYTV